MTRPRLILDSNLYVNFLLSPNPAGSAVSFILHAAADGIVDVLLPIDVIAELTVVVSERPHLRRRITREELEAYFTWLAGFATLVPALEVEPPSVVRDQKDDYLVALAAMHAADYLVSRDKDLLALRELRGIRFVDPVEVVALLRQGN